MRSKARLLGHPIHPMLIVFPLGLLATAVIFDIVHGITGNGGWTGIAYYLIAAGVIGGLVAAVFGLIDWLGIPSGTRAKRVGAFHGLTNLSVVVLFAVSWFVRREAPTDPATIAYVLSAVGAGAALIGGWLGGELVDRLGVGVDDGAHLDAPSSLTHRDATTRAQLPR
jgi:uncharacterized membrane protein